MGVTLACFHGDGTLPLARENLNKSDIGEESGCASSFRIILLIESGPAALPVLRARNVDSTSAGNVEILSSWKGGLMDVDGRIAFVSFKNVCLVKCLFKISAFSCSVKKITPSCESGGNPEVCSGFISGFSVLHQSFGPMFEVSNFVAKCLLSSHLDFRVSFFTLFLGCLYLSKSLVLFVCLHLSYKRFFFLISRLMSFVSHDGSDCLTFIILFRTCLLVSSRILSVKLLAYVSTLSRFKESQSVLCKIVFKSLMITSVI